MLHYTTAHRCILDTTGRFDAAGTQINPNLGRFTGAALGRRTVLALKIYFQTCSSSCPK